MTHAEQIFRGAVDLTFYRGTRVFRRLDCRDLLQIDTAEWNASYNPAFQDMRADQPGGAPSVALRYRNVFRRVRHGEYALTEAGLQLTKELLAPSLGP